MQRPLAILFFWSCISGLMAFPAFASSDCMGGLQVALVAGGYSGGTDCKKAKFEIRKVTSKESTFPFTVYYLRYWTFPLFAGAEVHGGEKVLIFKGRKYLGQYPIDSVPGYPPTLVGNDLVFERMPGTFGNVIHFTKDEPPSKAWIDGYIEGFGK